MVKQFPNPRSSKHPLLSVAPLPSLSLSSSSLSLSICHAVTVVVVHRHRHRPHHLLDVSIIIVARYVVAIVICGAVTLAIVIATVICCAVAVVVCRAVAVAVAIVSVIIIRCSVFAGVVVRRAVVDVIVTVIIVVPCAVAVVLAIVIMLSLLPVAHWCLCCRHCRCCSEMPSSRQRGSSLPPPPSIRLSSSFSSSSLSSRRNCRTCVYLLDLVNPASITTPFLHTARAIRSPCNGISRRQWAAECSDFRAASTTSPPPVWRRSLTMPPLSPSSSVAVALFHCPPLPPALVRALCRVQRIDRRCGKRASVVTFFSAPTVIMGPVVAIAAAPVLLGITAIGAREAPTPAPAPRS